MIIGDIVPHRHLARDVRGLAVKGICEDSRLIKKGDIFFAKERKKFDIFSVVKKVENDAVAFVADAKNKKRLDRLIKRKPVIYVKDVQKEFYHAVDRFYAFNTNDFIFIGVTGTNGKTTTTSLVYYLLKELGQNVSLIGTVKYYIGKHAYCADYTTPGYLKLREIFRKVKREKIRFVVMEVSSHGLQQERIIGINFARCVFTNLSRDHLDYHKTMKSYFNAKKRLFMQNKEALSIINVDDIYGRRLLGNLKNIRSYGITHPSDFRACNIQWSKKKSTFRLIHNGRNLAVETKLYGRHNILNILAAITTVHSLGFSLKKICKAIPSFDGVEGRLQGVGPGIFVDYAHTPDALKAVLLTLRNVGYERIICVFGCGGNRDKGKRKLMGAIAGRYATFSFITSDNPRTESALKIAHQIEEGFKGRNFSIILNRKKAIAEALKRKHKHKNCCLIIAGKGHEEYQIIGSRKMVFKDSKVAKQLLKRH
ncbi:MAG: UDP-N-acetylmuramoyl-L-alanyl-D-glutamate--2,6-diaminopimelate ligase [Candidatus Omnitrophota bacterium]|nr:MAG: UDP-N-acetylmuramoyl-L-alanyl-D-glutamate--2,6-diaminopimelate ligase [Candidatus Omnitrophota bacterium]